MSYNEIFAGLLSRLATAMSNSGEQMKAKAYKAAEEVILAFPSSIKSIKDMDEVSKIGPSIKQKLQEYLETGKIKVLEEFENRPENIFINVYGIGPKKSSDIVKKGILTIADLRQHQDELLNDVQRTGLKYYEDILKRIPRSEIDLYDKSLKAVLRGIKGAKYEIVGSYRRGQRDSGDIDVILTAAEAGAFDRFLDVLIKKGMIVEVLSRGKNKCLVIAKIPKSASFRRVDFLYATPEEYPFSVLYFTGSKGFNVVMRGYSLSKGYSLNEHGFTPSFPDKKISEERDIFDALGLQYKSPEERMDGRAVRPISNGSPKPSIKDPIGEPVGQPIGVFDSNQILEKPAEEVLPTKTRKKREPKKDRQKKVIKEILDEAPGAPEALKTPKTPPDSQRTISDNISLSDKSESAIEEVLPTKTRKKREPKKDRQKKVIKEILDEAPKTPPDSQRTISDNILLSDKPESAIEEVLPKKKEKTRKKREPKDKRISPVVATLDAPSAPNNISLSDKPESTIEEVLPKKTRKKREPKKDRQKKVIKEILDEAPGAPEALKTPKTPPDSQRTISENILLSDKSETPIEEVLPKKKEKTRKKREPKDKRISPVVATLDAPSAPNNIPLSDKPESAIEEVLSKKTRKKREPKKDRQKKVIKEILDEAPEAPKTPPDSQRTISENILLSDKPESAIEKVLPKKKEKTRKKREPKEDKKKDKRISPVVATLDAPKAPNNISLSDKPESVIEEVLPKKSKKKEIKTEVVSKEIMDIVTEFKQKGLPVLEPLSKKVLEEFIEFLDDSYYNDNPLLTDNEYDIVKEYKDKRFPSKDTVCKIGAPIKGKNKVALPFEMASMDKIKPDSGALAGWTAKYKGPYLLSCKLDGVSGLYECNQKGEYKLYTRGDGCVGQDISHLIRALELPKIPIGMAVRGEFILSKSIFKEKYSAKFANARNLVSGIVNSKEGAGAKDLHFVAYEVIQPLVKPSQQMNMLKTAHFRVVQNEIRPLLSNEALSEVLVNWRTSYEYDIDGVIVTNDEIHPRVSGNPEYAFAFKMVLSDQLAEAKVVDVLWEASKDGYLKPRVRIEPIKLGGVTIEYATGFNGKFIEENKIGIGALIQMVRSGDVIPYIKSVTVPAEKAKMPLVPFIWNKTHVDVLLENPHEDEGVQEKNITSFFVTIGVDGLAKGGVHKLYKAGKTTIADILKMSAVDLEQIDGFQKKTATKLADGIREKVAAASLLTIMVASGKMGRGLGERKIQPILEALPDILISQETPEIIQQKIKQVPGIGPENAREFVKNIPAFLGFLKETGLEDKLTAPATAAPTVEGPLTGKKIVMTKVRDQAIISFVTNQGGSFEDSMKKDVMVLIVKSKEDVSNKTEYATKNGIPIMTVEEFKKEYM